MQKTIALVREYNKLAISMPDKKWSTKFAHARMEIVGNRVRFHYSVSAVDEGKQVWVPRQASLLVADIPTELARLKRRAAGDKK